MVQKIAGLARLVGTLLAIVAGLVTLPDTFNVELTLVILGLIAGLVYAADDAPRLFLVVLVLPFVGGALGVIPTIGDRLSAVALNIALAAAGAAATVIALRLFNNTKADLGSWTAGTGDAKPAAAAG